MEQALFSITCTTCRARLRVRSEEAIGEILGCPRCGSMVQVLAPEGWEPPQPADAQPDDPGTHTNGGIDTASKTHGVEAAAGVGDGTASPRMLGVSPAELAWRKWLLWGAAPTAGLVVMVGVCSIVFWRQRPQPQPSPVVEQPAGPDDTAQPPAPEDQADPLPTQLDHRWLPQKTALLLMLQPSRLVEEPGFGEVVAQFDGQRQQTVGAVMDSLGLRPEAIRRLTWASTDLAAWPDGSVVQIELEQGYDAASLKGIGEAVDLELAGVSCRRLSDAAWEHPFALVDERTIVTGRVDLLRDLAGRSDAGPQSDTMRRLLPLAVWESELTLLVDLAAARQAGWTLPTTVLDVWPEGSQPWHVIWELSGGLACRLHGSGGSRSELVLVCEGETVAEKVHAAVEQLVPAGRKWLAGQIEAIAAGEGNGGVDKAAAQHYQVLLKEGLAAANAARWKVADGAVWVWVDGGRGPWTTAAAVADSGPAIRTAWLAAAREADEANHRRLLAGLEAYGQAQGRFPAAAVGAARLSPEERLSWIAALLPFYGHQEWHHRLDSGQAWNSPQNRPVTEQPLPDVINPALATRRTEAGFPTTHYVGVAGVGPDAARLKADDPRAGVFGHGRQTRPEEIADGAANTIALLGVSEGLGPWAAGGQPTVRPLTEPPYVNGPDGFGSGQPDGMMAGMADGSVRFISRDVDPRVLEQLSTINGERAGGPVALGPEAGPAQPHRDEPEPEVHRPGDTPVEPQPELPPEAPQPVAPVQVDVEARLADTLPEIRLRETPLATAVDLLADMSTVPMTFDPEAMQQLGVTLRDPVTVELKGATVGEALRAVLSRRGLAVVVEDSQILLTSPADRRERLWPRRYTVSDLTGQDALAVAELAALVRRVIAPDSWRAVGGRGEIKPDGGALVVEQTSGVHDQIVTFCEKLRKARGKPLRSGLSPDRFALESRTQRARATLGRPVTANFHEPTPMIEILAYLGRLAETDILVDRLALAAAGLSDQTAVRVTAVKQPLGEVLQGLLAPLDLQYRVIGAGTLQVSSRKAIAARLELEFYPVGELLTGGQTGPALVEQIKGRLAGSTWSDAGGPGVLHFDPPSSCLIVLQSQPVQGALERLLAEMRN